jgi:hypothetical protein
MPMLPEQDEFSQRLMDELNRGRAPGPSNVREEGTKQFDCPSECPPVGQGNHVVRNGECISSIARDTGHFWETLWSEPANAELREARKEPNVLLADDRVFVPPLRPKFEPGASEMRHRFVRRGEPAKIRMVLKRAGKPRANEPYTLNIDGQVFSGTLDPEGKLERAIPGNARKGTLTVGEPPNQSVYPLNLGTLDPITSLAGVQARLNNLGFGCGEVDGIWGPKTSAAVRKFQGRYQLSDTGELDDATRTKVKDVHGY